LRGRSQSRFMVVPFPNARIRDGSGRAKTRRYGGPHGGGWKLLPDDVVRFLRERTSIDSPAKLGKTHSHECLYPHHYRNHEPCSHPTRWATGGVCALGQAGFRHKASPERMRLFVGCDFLRLTFSTETCMTDSSSCLTSCNRLHGGSSKHLGGSGRRVVVHLELYPGQTLSWCVERDSELGTYASRVRVIGHFLPHSHWLQPGEVVRLARGQRIWC
jgi:hypothetical protein